jgi:hypothetical protein
MMMTKTMTMTVTVTVTTTNQKLQLPTVNQSHTRRDLLELLAAFHEALSRKKTLVKVKTYVRDNYSTIALWPFKPVKTKKKKKQKRPTFTEPPTKLTDTDAYFNYLSISRNNVTIKLSHREHKTMIESRRQQGEA